MLFSVAFFLSCDCFICSKCHPIWRKPDSVRIECILFQGINAFNAIKIYEITKSKWIDDLHQIEHFHDLNLWRWKSDFKSFASGIRMHEQEERKIENKTGRECGRLQQVLLSWKCCQNQNQKYITLIYNIIAFEWTINNWPMRIYLTNACCILKRFEWQTDCHRQFLIKCLLLSEHVSQ